MITKNKSTKPEEEYQCPLCGYRFHWKEAKQCHTCPIQKRCALIMCPRCNYEFPDNNRMSHRFPNK